MLRRLCILLVVVSCTPSDEGDTSSGSSESTGAPDTEPHVNFSGKVDVVDLCGVQGANLVSFRAFKVGCAKAGPCTIQTDPFEEFVGDAATCPSGQSFLDMVVRVPASAKYQVEARTLTDSGHLSRCYALDGAATLTVTPEQIEARETVHLTVLGGPCPSP